MQAGGNDTRRGQAGQTAGNIAQIQSRLAAASTSPPQTTTASPLTSCPRPGRPWGG